MPSQSVSVQSKKVVKCMGYLCSRAVALEIEWPCFLEMWALIQFPPALASGLAAWDPDPSTTLLSVGPCLRWPRQNPKMKPGSLIKPYMLVFTIVSCTTSADGQPSHCGLRF